MANEAPAETPRIGATLSREEIEERAVEIIRDMTEATNKLIAHLEKKDRAYEFYKNQFLYRLRLVVCQDFFDYFPLRAFNC